MKYTPPPFAQARHALWLPLALLLNACSPQASAPAPAPRPVKIEVMAARSEVASAGYMGTVRSLQRADLSFESSGRISTLLVDTGDSVRAGQTLATLDEAPARQRLAKAQAELSAAQATLADRQTQLHQQEGLAKAQVISAVALESAQTQHRLAQTQLQVAQAALALAERDLAMSRMVAPYDGSIVARLAQPHGDVAGGQPVLQLEGRQAREVVALLPQSVAGGLLPGAQARMQDTGRGTTPVLRLARLAERIDNGSLVQAIFQAEGDGVLPPSGTAVSLELPSSSKAAPGLSLPAEALLLGDKPGEASVFLLRQDKLIQQAVRIAPRLVAGGRVPVLAGLQVGDRVVAAGASFLKPGEAAVEYRPTTALVGAAS